MSDHFFVKQQQHLKELYIADNKIYNEIHQNILMEADHNNEQRRILRKRILRENGTVKIETIDQEGSNKNQKLIVKFKYRSELIRRAESEESELDLEKIKVDASQSESDEDDESEDELAYRGALSLKDSYNEKAIPTADDRLVFKKLATKIQKSNDSLKYIQIRNFKIRTWYTSPYPEEYNSTPTLYLCENCLKYINDKYILERHEQKCFEYHPPGRQIYQNGLNSIWEIDGYKNLNYCQNLCLMAKLFLNSKTLYYDVEPFMFYILTEYDPETQKHNFVGYFSKEKVNTTHYNVSCILTLPIYQRKGYGNLLIDFSYLLTKAEFKCGTPEKPLSELGLVSYRNYWKLTIAYLLKSIDSSSISIRELAKQSGMLDNDVIVGLELCQSLLRNYSTGEYMIIVNIPKITEIIQRWESKGYVKLDARKLLWKPLIFASSAGINQPIENRTENDLIKENIETLNEYLLDRVPKYEQFETDKNAANDDNQDDLDFDDEDSEYKLENYEFCFPGMDLNLRKFISKKVIELGDDDEDEDSRNADDPVLPLNGHSAVFAPSEVLDSELKEEPSENEEEQLENSLEENDGPDENEDYEDTYSNSSLLSLSSDDNNSSDESNAINLKKSARLMHQRVQSKNISQLQNRRKLRSNEK
ncbi:hypothetical protein WICMUC_005818 [Wickerhamomyces mucosus]|uniref:Histone acetyltransferase n=1 Tax=Wickerhamomyces mucosus TaxID=1378264 RepID=A0A9P8P259_9ASCO|nr:hypothetical protein WICMUC_005818 [Wickerhamomyces mucosus]